jgi:site-specific recombinase XerD
MPPVTPERRALHRLTIRSQSASPTGIRDAGSTNVVTAVPPDGYAMHTLRHRFATRAYRGSRNLRSVQTLLGHASIATMERYTAVDDDEVRAAAACAW